MTTYEGWSNQETFMVASMIDNDEMFLKLVLDTVQNYIAQGREPQLKDKLYNICNEMIGMPPRYGVKREQRDFQLIRLRLKHTLRKLVLEAFFDAVDWSELVEHYKTKYVESLVHDKDVLEQIDKDKLSNSSSLLPEIKRKTLLIPELEEIFFPENEKVNDPILDILDSIPDTDNNK